MFMMNSSSSAGRISVYASTIISFFVSTLGRFTIRDFIFSEEEIAKQRQELDTADVTERELWVMLPRTREYSQIDFL